MLFRWFLLLALLVPTVARAEPPRFELIYSQPVETALQQPLRAPTELWPALFEGAQKSIDIEQFYLASEPGEALEPVLAALEKAARRGVAVRVLIEQKFWKQSQPTAERIKTWPNTQLRVIDWSKLDPGPGRKAGGIVHAKFFTVDAKTGYLGSQNFDWRSLAHVQELGVLVRDVHISQQLQAIFEQDWRAQASLEAHQPVATLPAQAAPERPASGYLVGSPPEWLPAGVGPSEAELVRLIDSAKKRLQIQTLKYEPLSHDRRFYPVIDTALRAAAARGVAIELLVSDWNADQPGQKWLQSLACVPGVQIRMVTIPQAKRGFIPFARTIHAKYMVLDDALLWVGTSNWQGGYLNESRNVELVLPASELAAQAAALHAQLWASPYAHAVVPGQDVPRVRREERK